MMFNPGEKFPGKTILITGTTSGIGEALMKAYLSRGDRVIAVNRREISRDLPGGNLMAHRADVTKVREVDDLFRVLGSREIFPDVYVLNAGINLPDNNGLFDGVSFEKVIETNLLGVLRFVSRGMDLSPHRKKTFVAMSSTSNIFPNPASAGYYVSKLGVTKSFDILRLKHQNAWNDFKTVILGPVRTKMLPSGPMASRLQTFVRDAISLSVDQATPKLLQFIDSRRSVLNYTILSHIVFHMARIATCIAPGLYKGSSRK